MSERGLRRTGIALAITLASWWFGAFARPESLLPSPFLPDTLFVVGTPTTDAQQRSWGYVLWLGTDQQLVLGHHFAIYAKAGDPGTPGAFERRAVVGLQLEPPVIQALLARAQALGDDLAQLESRIDSLFAALQPPAGPLANKLSAVIRGALADPQHFQNLALLGRLHPGLNFCLGYAHAEPIAAGKTTFEIREFDVRLGQDLGVVGRVTVEAGRPTSLPAPGPLVQVPEATAKGDLNARFRWASPPELRRLTLLNHGFNLYRVARAEAERRGFHQAAPSGAVLRQLAAQSDAVHQVNTLPILQAKDFEAATVGDFTADPGTAFIVDDHDRYRAGGTPFRNGEQFYYFVTARDVLGRDGLASPGVLVTMCDRVPPDAPRGVQVQNHYAYANGTGKQALEVSWLQSTNPADRVVHYHVYRWDNARQAQELAGDPAAHRIAGPLAHLAGQARQRYVDDTPTSPRSPADDGRTFWYTVRAGDDGACSEGNLSAHSAPAFGVLRDRSGPAGPDGDLLVRCCVPTAKGLSAHDEPAKVHQDPALAYYQLTCRRTHPELDWAEFYFRAPGLPENFIARAYFPRGADEVTVDWTLDRTLVAEGSIPFFCRVGTNAEEVSDFASVMTNRAPKDSTVRVVSFEGGYPCRPVSRREISAATGQVPRGCTGSHDPDPHVDLGELVGITINLHLTPGTKEYRLYRRVDQGPLTLIRQGPADFDDASQITIVDPDMPANAASVCYFGQLFDEQGNASPLVQLSECVEVKRPTAVPMLAPLEARGNLEAPRLRIRWFCAPYGVDRFQVSIANRLGAMAAVISTDLESQSGQGTKSYSLRGVTQTNLFFFYRTLRVGPAFGNGAMFEIEVDAELGTTYDVLVAAVGVDGSVNQDSNAESFRWTPPPPALGPEVPWPLRPLPNVTPFHASLRAFRLPDGFYPGIGLRLGTFSRAYLPDKTSTPNHPTQLRGHLDPASLLYRNNLGQGPLPLVAYRVQAPSAAFPRVSGDLIQVTPLLERIAHELTAENGTKFTTIHDPYVRVGPNVDPAREPGDDGALYLLDTQPVIAGANYLYLLVRFQPNGEILDVFPSNPVEVTP